MADHTKRFDSSRNPDNGRNEHFGEPTQKPLAPRSHSPAPEIKDIVMAKVIEFYIPKNFWKSLNWAPQLQRGKVIEFYLPTKQSA